MSGSGKLCAVGYAPNDVGIWDANDGPSILTCGVQRQVRPDTALPPLRHCIVTMALPAGAPLKLRLQDLLNRIVTRSFVARPAPIVLQDGAIARVTVASGAKSLAATVTTRLGFSPSHPKKFTQGGALVLYSLEQPIRLGSR